MEVDLTERHINGRLGQSFYGRTAREIRTQKRRVTRSLRPIIHDVVALPDEPTIALYTLERFCGELAINAPADFPPL